MTKSERVAQHAAHAHKLICWSCGKPAQPGRPLHWVGMGEADYAAENWAHRHCPKSA